VVGFRRGEKEDVKSKLAVKSVLDPRR
jgi:hypothetical protein